MKIKYLSIPLSLGVSLILVLLWLLGSSSTPVTAAHERESQQATADVITVCVSGGCDYVNIQAAVDAAGDGDVIKVATGTYTDVHVRPRNDITTTGVVTQVVYISKTVIIQGGYTTSNWTTRDPEANPTTLDAQGQGRVLYITGEINPTVDGLRITGGDGTGMGGLAPRFGGGEEHVGGGVYIITATANIKDNHIFSNTITAGGCGGVFLLRSNATLSGNTVSNNTVPDGNGGGLCLDISDATVSRNTFYDNHCRYSGGGLSLMASNATLFDNTFVSNTAGDGGGMFLWLSSPTLSGNTFISNTVEGGGGGLYLMFSSPTVINNVIADNRIVDNPRPDAAGSGLYIVGDNGSFSRWLHTTIARNTGGPGSGIYVTEEDGDIPGTVAFTNTIVVSHSVGISVASGNTVTVNGVLWHNTPITVSQFSTATVMVENQHTGDPAFAADGYHLTAGSRAIDKGVYAGVTKDIDDEPRPASAGYDLGADELWYKIYLPLVIRNYQP